MEGEKLFAHWQQQQQHREVSMSEMVSGSGTSLPISDQLHHPTHLHINWDQSSMDQASHFESALSSIVSSPSSHAPTAGDSVIIHELIGRLGSICNSGEISIPSHHYSAAAAAASCYSTPLNSPPKLNLSMLDPGLQFPQRSPDLPFTADPGFAERAARFAAFGVRNYPAAHVPLPESGKLSRASSSKSLMASRPCTPEDGREESSASGAVAAEVAKEGNGRKRKAGQRGKGNSTAKDLPKVATEEDANAKKTKSSEGAGKGKDGANPAEDLSGDANSDGGTKQQPEPPKQDYIHVRARRGQATDSHSLAERVRREKISERMKFLQNLVPGCNKVTGKAVMLDEIINYVQSLQRQVEFLSMKLATLNPRLDFNMDGLLPKDMLQQRGPMQHSGFPVEAHISPLSFPFPPQPSHGSPLQSIVTNGIDSHCATNPMEVAIRPPFNGIDAVTPQIGTLWEDDFHSFVQMSYSQNQELPFPSQSLHAAGSLPTPHMKVEL